MMFDDRSTYLPGDHHVVVLPEVLAFVETGRDATVAAEIVAFIQEAHTWHDLLRFLFDLDRSRLPSFGIARLEDGLLRTLVRGDVTYVVELADDTEQVVDGANVVSWNEGAIENATGIFIAESSNSSNGVPPDSSYWVQEGHILARAVQVHVTEYASNDQPVLEPLETPPALPSPAEIDDEFRDVDSQPGGDERENGTPTVASEEADAEQDEPLPDDSEPARSEESSDVDDEDSFDNEDSVDDVENSTSEMSTLEVQLVDDPGIIDVESDVAQTRHGNETVHFIDMHAQDSSEQVNENLEPEPVTAPSEPNAEVSSQHEDDDDDDYDYLFGDTTHFQASVASHADTDQEQDSSAAAQVAPGPGVGSPGHSLLGPPPGMPASSPSGAGASGAGKGGEPDELNHDGMTISLAQLREMAARDAQKVNGAPAGLLGNPLGPPPVNPSAPSQIRSTPVTSAPGVMVKAVTCPAGHLNPPQDLLCRICGVGINDQPSVDVQRPALGVLNFTNGHVQTINNSMIVGRSPKLPTHLDGQMPDLVRIPSPLKEISGTHLEVRVDGWQVLIKDLQSTNGSFLKIGDREPRRLHPGEFVPLPVNAVVDLGGEVSFTYEATA